MYVSVVRWFLSARLRASEEKNHLTAIGLLFFYLSNYQFTMSKVTVSAILTIIRIALTLGEKLVRSIYMVLDIVDDGIVNNSVSKPEWYEKVVSAISNIEFALHSVADVADVLSLPQKTVSSAE